jgi:hypothetical protein
MSVRTKIQQRNSRPDRSGRGTPMRKPLAMQGVWWHARRNSNPQPPDPKSHNPHTSPYRPVLLRHGRYGLPLVAVPWGTVLYRPVPRRWVGDRVAEPSAVPEPDLYRLGIRAEVAPHDPSWHAIEPIQPPLHAFARQGVTMLNQKFDPRSSSEPSSSLNASRFPST